MNKGTALVTVTGTEIKQLQGGSTLGILRGLIANQRKDSQSGQWQDDPIAVEFSGFNSKYRAVADDIGKLQNGSSCLVEYKFGQNRWVDQKTNQQRQRVTFIAEAIHCFGQSQAKTQQQAQPQAQTTQALNDAADVPF